MSFEQVFLIAMAAFCAGAMNAVAGGGTFLSFPALLAIGVPPVVANASNSVALWPASLSGAWAYRAELSSLRHLLLPMSAVSLVGGVAGGLLLLTTRNETFTKLIPWLLLFATLLFALSGAISARLKSASTDRVRNKGLRWLGQLLVSIYGGFFGAGMGILMLASLAMSGHRDVHETNAIKNLLSAVIYSVTVVTFVAAGAVSWPHTLVMLIAATLGGYGGASFARRIPSAWLKRFIIVTGLFLSGFYFYKTL